MMKHKLPENWIALNSKSRPDKIYYFNVKTNQSSWKKPTANQAEQVKRKSIRFSKNSKKSIQKDEVCQVRPSTPECDASEKEVFERRKLVAKRSIKQTQEKVDEEKETPQMKAIREKMLKRKEKNSPKIQSSKSSKDIAKSVPSEPDKSSPSVQKSSDLKTALTPQMQILLEKMQEKVSKHSSKTKKKEDGKSNVIHKQGKPINTRLRNQVVCDIKDVSSCKNKSQEEEQNSPKVATSKTSMGKRKNEDSDSIEVIAVKQSRKSFKKNLGKERMENLRKSLTVKYDDSLDHNTDIPISSSSLKKFGEKIPSIYKKAEVRLVRLKERFVNDKIFNRNPCIDQGEEITTLSQDSVTTTDDLIKRSHEDSLYEEMDWEPLEDEKITFEVQSVRTELCAKNNRNTLHNVPCNTLKYPLLPEKQTKRYLYIVVDTNVFLSNIEAVELAKETTFKTYDHSLIVIPWTVIRELDYIKNDNGKSKPTTLCIKARKAVNFINKLFSSKDSNTIGQTPEDVAKNREKFAVDCPDDEILQTCLQIRDLGKSVVLLSYDVNLCNKAMIYDIVTLGRNDPIEKVDFLNASHYANECLSISNNENRERSSLGSTSILSQELALSDEIYEDTKSIIRDFLTVIVSKEMYSLYGESWEKYVIIKPPWTTVTVLQCAVKHWIAAISESFQRKAEVILKELLEIFKNASGRKILKENNYILDKCSDLVQLVNIDKHSDLMLRVSKKIDELTKKCRDYELQINDQKLRDAIGVENNTEEEERRAEKAFQYFEAAYVYARDMCGLMAERVGMPCNFQYNIPNPLPSEGFIKQVQPELAANVNKLLCSLSVVTEQVQNSCTDYRTLTNLYQTLITFLPDIASTAIKLSDIDLVPLDVYCCVKRKQEVLNRGLRQLQELSTHFCRLASYRCI